MSYMNEFNSSNRRETTLSCLLTPSRHSFLSILLTLLHHSHRSKRLQQKRIQKSLSLTRLSIRSQSFKISWHNVHLLLHRVSIFILKMRIAFSSSFHISETYFSLGQTILSSIKSILFVRIIFSFKLCSSICMTIMLMRWNMKTKLDILRKQIPQFLTFKLFKLSWRLSNLNSNSNILYSSMN